MKILFVAWIALSRRTESLSASLGTKILLLNGDKPNRFSRLWHYIYLTGKTLQLLKSEKPDVIFVQNPPVYAVIPVFLYSRWKGKKYIIDSHTQTFLVERFHHHIFVLLHRFFSKYSQILLLHNEDLLNIVKHWNVSSMILETWIPRFQELPSKAEKSIASVVVICSFSSDEPIEEILKAAQRMGTVQFYITGDPEKLKPVLRKSRSENITFTGFLENKEFIRLLQNSDVIMVLTTRLYTLLCGAYEALAMEKPLITSNLPLLRRHFNKGTIHVENTAEGIAAGIREGFSRLEHLRKESVELREEKEREWNEKFEILKRILYETTG